MKYIIILLIFLLIPLVSADTTFFDNSDDVFIMGNSPATTGGVIITEEQQANSGSGCLYKWNCTNWSECFPSGKQTRNCTNIGTCSDTYKFPAIEQNCTYNVSKIKEESKVLENETEKISEKEIENKDMVFLYVAIVLIIGFIVFYLKKDYFKRLIKNLENIFFLSR